MMMKVVFAIALQMGASAVEPHAGKPAFNYTFGAN